MKIKEQVDVTKLSKDHQEPNWLLKQRLTSLQEAKVLPLPKVEKTRIQDWAFEDFRFDDERADQLKIEQLPPEIQSFLIREENAPIIVQQNHQIVSRPDAKQLDQGVIFTDLQEAVRQHESFVQPYLFSTLENNKNKLFSLHKALWSGGVFLYVPRNQTIEVPLQALFWLKGEQIGMFPHVVVVAEENSRVELIANFVAEFDDAPSVNNAVVEVFVGQNANVRIATVNNLPQSVVDVIYRRAIVERDGQLEWVVGDFSEGRLISDNYTMLKGEGSQVKVKAVTMGAGEMRANITSTVDHLARYTTSDILARSVMKNRASSILNSITKIEKGASKANGQQSGKVLMLDAKARGDANPILLIDENDVIAGHSASVGRVDPMQIYYLMSRGIPREEAEKLIVNGFLETILANIPSKSLRERLDRVIERKFQL
mgnify:CR=1 FL=1